MVFLANIRVDIFNQSTVLKDSEIAKMIPDLQLQVTRDFSPVWIIGAQLNFVPAGKALPPGGWQLGIFDLSDQANALGYHELTQQGYPLAKVFAKTDQLTNSNPTITISHELLEMLADPYISSCFNAQTTAFNRFYAAEVCDAVEADSQGYKMPGGNIVSNFVFPDWFNPMWAANTRQLDQMKQTVSPLQLTKGGYISYIDMATPTIGWQQVFGDNKPANFRSRSADRILKRELPRNVWRKSQPVSQKK